MFVYDMITIYAIFEYIHIYIILMLELSFDH